MIDWLNRACKFRTVFAGWQLGSRSDTDPECQAVRDHRDLSTVLRVESSAISALLIKKGIFTAEELRNAIQEEAEILCHKYEKRFPGFTATDYGLVIDPKLAAETTKGWRP